jgi:transcription elongation GreA/GreB family factor
LVNKTAGDSIEIIIPAGKKQYIIKKVITFHGTELKG